MKSTLDSKTSDICRMMDGKVFDLKDYKIGYTAPPFHQRCRTCTMPYFDDEFTEDEERAARDLDGKYYLLPSKTKYNEWYSSFVDDKGVNQMFVKETMEKRSSTDKAQFNCYKSLLGRTNTPKTFAEFQQMKLKILKNFTLIILMK